MNQETLPKLRDVVWEYVDVIARLGNGTLDARTGDQRRRDLHNDILRITGLSTFEFGGLPAWYEIENTDRTTTRLVAALRQQMSNKRQQEATQ